MHPAPSVIIFTTFSGLGFGLLAWLGLGFPDVSGGTAFAFFFIAYALAVGGLLASTFHLGNRKNAIYAFSQWRTSWLSREGIASVMTLLVFAPYALSLIFADTALPFLGYLGSILALITVFTTSMIYTQLKTIPRWNMPLNPVLFLLYALSGGALMAGEAKVAGVLILLLTLLQVAAWKMGDDRLSSTGTDKGTATGLGSIGTVRMLESAHTARNYILDEMVHIIGRKHAQKLRMIAGILIGALPAAILLLTPAGHVTSFVALACHILGVIVGRWLFFAEAEHVVGMYYSRD
ncbi:DmsC/YnfH family molybdoenzyme membrane anchor subunit [Aliiroseovarius subalbicans]|uniref:dimethyl sulfoxide reductase anchor subunit family protein n=1 Tax=Aliiroseovarius subalbicans TaxID=2925840 RepID=UPI001F59E002|nr:DmsC/YnfH family molybdoenzyme membrane anchor subunit [Aliiroseovarius subalbicans]MCI2400124.1 dimethyl sulfoxide reductase anchor subunit [Aliiroseovarius subalbicans]